MSNRMKQIKRTLSMSSTLPPSVGGGQPMLMGSAHTHGCGHKHAPGESCSHDHVHDENCKHEH